MHAGYVRTLCERRSDGEQVMLRVRRTKDMTDNIDQQCSKSARRRPNTKLEFGQ